ncbi:MAG: HEPN domain-containing protein [Candidatus Kuenenbacteria bacterium]
MHINIKEQSKYWLKNAEEKWKTAHSLLKSNRYADCLFFCHLTLECLLKGLVVIDTKKIPLFTHDLLLLADKTTIILTNDLKEKLQIITTFNLTNRYPDKKFEFYKKIDKEYSEEWFKNTNKLRLWILKKY